jgi:hypothetical protein
MSLRHSTVTKNCKSHTYWRLVRSVRSVRVGAKMRSDRRQLFFNDPTTG